MNIERLICCGGLTLLMGCGIAGADNDLEDIEVGLAAGVTLGQSARLALDAIEGSGDVRCATVVTACADYPCDGEVRIDYGPGCPLPLGGAAVGSTTVTGHWSSAEQADLDFAFTDVRVGERGGVLASATTISATRANGMTTIEYSGSRATARGPIALAAAASWDVTVDDAGTPDDASDDVYTVNGSRTTAGGTSALVVQVDDAIISPDCALNPINGSASITQSGLNIRTDELTFTAACDGTAQLEPTLGGTRTVQLDFLVD